MPSKRSYFNRTLFRKHLSRFWPLWGGVSLVGAMFPLYILLALMQRMSGMVSKSDDFAQGLYQMVTAFVPGFTCVYAILCVMAVWGYLYNARSVGLMHTLPVDRTCLFVTNTLAALAMVLIPYVVVGGLLCLIALGWGFFHLVAVVNTVLAVVFIAVLFTGIATLCAMLTGHGFVLPVFYLLANFLAFLMEMLVTNLAHEFLLGVPMLEDLGRLTFLSPVVQIYQSFSTYTERLGDDLYVSHLRGFWVVAVYALAGLALLALSWLLYKKRHSESAGDVVAFRWLRPVFRYGVALLSGLTIGRLLYAALWGGIFQKGNYAEVLPMAVCLFLGALIGYYAASMLLEKSLRVFKKKSLPGVGIVAAGTVALCLLVSVDVFGLVRKIPAWDEIESVSIRDRGDYSGPYSPEDNPGQAEALREFHQAVIADQDYIRSYVPDWDHDEGDVAFHHIYLTYRLKDGSELTRVYNLWLTRDRVDTAGTYENLLSAFYEDPVVGMDAVSIPEGSELHDINIYFGYSEDYYRSVSDRENYDQETRQIYAALQEDAAQGNIPARDVLETSDFTPFSLDLEYRIPQADGSAVYGGRKAVYLTPAMTNTIDVLLELDYVTEENIARWKEDLAQIQAEKDARTEQNTAYPEESIVYPE